MNLEWLCFRYSDNDSLNWVLSFLAIPQKTKKSSIPIFDNNESYFLLLSLSSSPLTDILEVLITLNLCIQMISKISNFPFWILDRFFTSVVYSQVMFSIESLFFEIPPSNDSGISNYQAKCIFGYLGSFSAAYIAFILNKIFNAFSLLIFIRKKTDTNLFFSRKFFAYKLQRQT